MGLPLIRQTSCPRVPGALSTGVGAVWAGEAQQVPSVSWDEGIAEPLDGHMMDTPKAAGRGRNVRGPRPMGAGLGTLQGLKQPQPQRGSSGPPGLQGSPAT